MTGGEMLPLGRIDLPPPRVPLTLVQQQHREAMTALLLAVAEFYGRALGDVQVELYWQAIADVPIDALTAAAGRWMQRSRFFPLPADLRTTVEDAAREQWVRDQQASTRDTPWRDECPDCADAGWRLHACAGSDTPGVTAPCGRKKAHVPHEYVSVCPCRSRNATYQRRHRPAVAGATNGTQVGRARRAKP